MASLTPSHRIDTFPPGVGSLRREFGSAELIRSALDLFVSKWRYRKRDSAHEILRYYLGSRQYELSGMRRYLEKLFGLPDHEVHRAFVEQRLDFIADVASLRRRVRSAVRLDKTVADRWQFNGFVRPRGGSDVTFGAVADRLVQRGVSIRSGSPVTRIQRRDNDVLVECGSETFAADRVVSTLPIGLTAHLAGISARSPVKSRALVTVCCTFSRSRHPATFLYNFAPDGEWKRITHLSDFYGRHRGRGYLSAEVVTESYADHEAIADRFLSHVAGAGLYEDLVVVGSVLTPNAYPVMTADVLAAADLLHSELAESRIEVAGRQGLHWYASSSQVAAASRVFTEAEPSEI